MTMGRSRPGKSRTRAAAALLALVLVLVMLSGPTFAQFGDWPDVFDPLQLRTLHLDMEPGDWATVQSDESLSIEVPAFFYEAGDTPILVSVRRKSGDPLNAAPGFTKVSLKIDINDFVSGQSWHGLKKLSLENGDDNDVVSEGMAWRLERMASGTQGYGYAVSHFAWVRLIINGTDTGVYINVEQPDKRFLENRLLLEENQTWLYKVSSVTGNLEPRVGTGDSPTVDALCYSPFASNPSCPIPDLATDVPQYVNMKGILTEFASDAYQGNNDALLTKGKNFYFADFLDGRLRMYFPWDRDSSLNAGAVNASIFPTPSPAGGDYNVLLDVPEFRAQYLEIFNDLMCGPWSEASLLAFVDAAEPVLSAALAADANNQFGDPAARFDAMRSWFSQRTASVISQIDDFEPCPSVQVSLNELMATNNTFLEDPDEPGEFPDWIELYNPAGETIDLGGLYLTDNPANPTKFQIPFGITIPPNGHLIFYADEDQEQGPLHTNFKLAGDGEMVAVFDTDGVNQIDSITFGPQYANVSYGRFPNGTGGWGFMSSPTPEAVNAPQNLPPIISNVSQVPELPGPSDAVQITAQVVDANDGVASVVLYYNTGSGWQNTPMLDDGLSGDGAAGDAVYGASVPAQPTDTVVDYYLLASDTLGATRTEPVAAPTLTHVYVVGYVPPSLFINEYMASNSTVIEDPDEPAAYEDWIEIYNAEPTPVDLSGMHLTDNLNQPTKFVIPAGVTIDGGGHLLIWADGEPEQGPSHTNFKLNAGGEALGLYDSAARGTIEIDTRVFGVQTSNVSDARCPDGGNDWQLLANPTPGVGNPPCVGGPEACCLPAGACQEIPASECLSLGGLSQGAGSNCLTANCPECVVDDDCDDGVFCTLDTCDPIVRSCFQTAFDSVCQDGLFCNGAEQCDALTGCTPGPIPCDSGSCNEANNICPGTEAGSLPDGNRVQGTPLTVARSGAEILLSWGASCTLTDDDYAVYEGTIGSFPSHDERVCSTGGEQEVTLSPGNGNRYYLVVPRNLASEGSHGRTSDGEERPTGASTCLTQQLAFCP
jgi:hypothetical protein